MVWPIRSARRPTTEPWSAATARKDAAASPMLPMPATMAAMVPAISAVSRSSSPMVSAICSVEFEVVVASSLTSSATTVKPRPSSPARAASMVAFSASSRVCPAMPWTRAAVAATRRRLCSSEAMTSSARRAWSTTAEVAVPVAEISLSMVSAACRTSATWSVTSRSSLGDHRGRLVDDRLGAVPQSHLGLPLLQEAETQLLVAYPLGEFDLDLLGDQAGPGGVQGLAEVAQLVPARGTARTAKSPSAIAVTPVTARATSCRVRQSTPAANQAASTNPPIAIAGTIVRARASPSR